MFFEASSAATAGFEVVVVAPHSGVSYRDGVRISGIPACRSIFERLTLSCWRCIRKGIAERADIYHLHEPDMVPWALLLRLAGKVIIYDVHEDYSTAAQDRQWIPNWARGIIAQGVAAISSLAQSMFTIIIAERYYQRLFPNAEQVLNYAKIDEYKHIWSIKRNTDNRIRVLYTGTVSESRGALHHIRLLDFLPYDSELHIVGRCNIKDLSTNLKRFENDRRLQLVLSDQWIPRDRVASTYNSPWTCGLALFPDTLHYREKELTKFFEYMAAGLPIVCSSFPVWRELVEGHGVGLCVDPEDPAAAVEAIVWMQLHPDEARAMGERGRHLVSTRFNWTSQADRLLSLYNRLAIPSMVAMGWLGVECP